jgi:predicted transcriptional regulator
LSDSRPVSSPLVPEAGLQGRVRQCGLTVAALARESGVSEREICRIRSGEVRRPHKDTVRALLQILRRQDG